MFVVREGESGEPEVRRVVRYPDSQQLFVGNVPHDVDRAELKEFFERKSASLCTRGKFACMMPHGLQCVLILSVIKCCLSDFRVWNSTGVEDQQWW